ncbi:vacuolar protein-sorting-associated protein 25 [Podarcis muralis]
MRIAATTTTAKYERLPQPGNPPRRKRAHGSRGPRSSMGARGGELRPGFCPEPLCGARGARGEPLRDGPRVGAGRRKRCSAPEAMMSFEWPWQYSFPPFFTLQPNVDTRQKQLTAWCSLALSYCRLNKLYTMTVAEAQESPLFNNWKLQRKLPLESIIVVLEELRKKGNLEWLDKNKSSFLIMWRRPEEWGKLIYQWVSKNGLTNSVFTLYELSNGDDTENEEFHGLEESMLLRALQALQQEHKAEIITLDDGRGVKFF